MCFHILIYSQKKNKHTKKQNKKLWHRVLFVVVVRFKDEEIALRKDNTVRRSSKKQKKTKAVFWLQILSSAHIIHTLLCKALWVASGERSGKKGTLSFGFQRGEETPVVEDRAPRTEGKALGLASHQWEKIFFLAQGWPHHCVHIPCPVVPLGSC